MLRGFPSFARCTIENIDGNKAGSNITISYLIITTSRRNSLDLFSSRGQSGVGIHERNVVLRLTRKKQKIVRRIFRELAFKHSTGACFERLTSPGNRDENTKRTGFAHVRSEGRSGCYYRSGNARQRAGIRAGGHHRAVAASADAHGSRARSPSWLCLGRRPLALGWPRLRMGAGPLEAGTGRRTLGAGSLGATGTELAMDRRSLGSLNPARPRSLSTVKADNHA